jgi:glyoxylase I family protein
MATSCGGPHEEVGTGCGQGRWVADIVRCIPSRRRRQGQPCLISVSPVLFQEISPAPQWRGEPPRTWRGDGSVDRMAQPSGEALDAVRARRAQLRSQYLIPSAERPQPLTRGVHHLALICRDVEETIRFYQGLLGFPLVELVENRDYAGSSHFFFDIGHGNLLGFFDFPGHDHPPFQETIGGVQHLALSVDAEHFATAARALAEAGIEVLGPDRGADRSLYFRDPNGVGLELYEEPLGSFEGTVLV